MKVQSKILMVYPCRSNLIKRAALNNLRNPTLKKLICVARIVYIETLKFFSFYESQIILSLVIWHMAVHFKSWTRHKSKKLKKAKIMYYVLMLKKFKAISKIRYWNMPKHASVLKNQNKKDNTWLNFWGGTTTVKELWKLKLFIFIKIQKQKNS